jgi:hypothetical protein
VGGSGTIQVASGTYTFNASTDVCTGAIGGTTAVVCFYNKQLRILGGYTTSDWSVANPTVNVTIIDGQNSYRGVRVQKAAPTAPTASLDIEGFTIQNGLAQGATSGSYVDGYGGGLFSENAPVIARNLILKNNQAIGGNTSSPAGGVGAGGGMALNTSTSFGITVSNTLDHVTFDSNQSRGGSGLTRGGAAHGGGLFTYNVTVNGTNLTFTNNTILAGSSAGSGRTSDNQTADALGGAGSFEVQSNVTLQYVTATGNTVTAGNAPAGDGGSGFGGAFFAEGATLNLLDANVRNNQALGGNGLNNSTNSSIAEGGGIMTIGASPLNTNVLLSRVYVIGNTAKSGNGTVNAGAVGGGGIALTFSGGTNQIVNSVIANNLADIGSGNWVGGGGGGLWLQGVSADVIHSTFVANQLGSAVQAQGAQGLAIILVTPFGSWSTTANIDFSIIADHTSINTPQGGLAALQATPNTTVNLSLGLYANNTKNDNSGDWPAYKGTINGAGTMLNATSAVFMAPGSPNFNYHIQGTSPAKDQATGSTTSVDIDNEPRPYPSGGKADIGADEYEPFSLPVVPGNGTLQMNWQAATNVVAGLLDHYEIVVTCPPGANPPDQGACGQPINTGVQTSFALTGLSNFKGYTLVVNARDASGNLILPSRTITAYPTNIFLFLPLIMR